MNGHLMFLLIALALLLPLGWWVTSGGSVATRVLGIGAALLLTAGLYLTLGTPAQIAPPLDPVDALAAQIEERLDQDPTDVDGWRALGRLRVSQSRFDDSAEAYAKARALTGDEDAAALVGYAEARLLGDPDRMLTEIAPLLDRALALAPNDPRALWYGGHAANERGDRALAEQRWRALLDLPIPPDLKRAVEAQLSGGSPHAAMGGGSGGATGGAVLFELEVTVSPALAGRVPPGAPMFLFVREGTGRIPLVAKRVNGFTLPAKYTLTANDLLSGPEALAAAASLAAGARISISGTASRTKGDLEGTVAIERGTPGRARVVIDSEVP